MTGPLRSVHLAVLILVLGLLPLAGAAEEQGPRVLLPYSSKEYEKLRQGTDLLINYTQALKGAGLRAIPSAPANPIPLSGVEGLLVPGGGEITPSLYEKDGVSTNPRNDMEFDRYELSVIDEAWKLDMPVLGICRGEELLNVSLGGTLYGDLHSTIGIIGGVEHRNPVTKIETNHIITIEEKSQLRAILGCPVKIVNSHHHHSVREPGKSLIITARSPDEVVEGIESPEKAFFLGVQFHPERLIQKDRLFLRLFCRFADEAARYGRKTKNTIQGNDRCIKP